MKTQRGFTLLEVLVALTLTSMLILVLFAGFRAGIRSWQAAETHIGRVEESRQFVSMLYRHMNQILPVVVAGENFFPESSFQGESERIRYVAPLSLSTGNRDYLFEIVNGWNGQEGIWARFAPFEAEAGISDMFEGVEFVQLAENMSVGFSFYEGEAGWQDTHAGEIPPSLVRADIVDAAGAWPQLTFTVSTRER